VSEDLQRLRRWVAPGATTEDGTPARPWAPGFVGRTATNGRSSSSGRLRCSSTALARPGLRAVAVALVVIELFAFSSLAAFDSAERLGAHQLGFSVAVVRGWRRWLVLVVGPSSNYSQVGAPYASEILLERALGDTDELQDPLGLRFRYSLWSTSRPLWCSVDNRPIATLPRPTVSGGPTRFNLVALQPPSASPSVSAS